MLGIVALCASVLAVLVGAVGIWLSGRALGRILRIVDYADLVIATEAQLWESLERALGALIILVIAWVAHALVACWGLVQGIVATALGRGRGWAIAAIAVALTGWILLFAVTQEALISGALGIVPFVDLFT